MCWDCVRGYCGEGEEVVFQSTEVNYVVIAMRISPEDVKIVGKVYVNFNQDFITPVQMRGF